MKKITTIVLAVFAVTIVFEAISQANPRKERTPRISRAQVNQHRRIQQGVRSGQLSKDEAAELRKGQQEIRQEKQEARADGVVTKEERKSIREDQKEQSKEIYKLKHNDVKAGGDTSAPAPEAPAAE